MTVTTQPEECSVATGRRPHRPGGDTVHEWNDDARTWHQQGRESMHARNGHPGRLGPATYQRESALTQWYLRRFAHGDPSARKIGIVAVARRLVIDLPRFLDVGVIPEGGDLETLADHPRWITADRGRMRDGRSGWFSCRSACYLAAGRPVVVQDTGFSRVIPTGTGVVAFNTLEEATAAVTEVEAHYDRHARRHVRSRPGISIPTRCWWISSSAR
jgi:hypothetical protein